MDKVARAIVAEPPPAMVWSAVAAFLGGIALGVALDLPPGAGALARGAAGAAPSPQGVTLILLAAAACAALAFAWAGRRGAGTDPRDAELAQVHSRLDMALEASGIGFWEVDLGTGALTWDERACAVFGVARRAGFYSEADWVGAIHPEDRARAVAAGDEAVARGGRFIQDYRVVWPDGQSRHVRDMAGYCEGADGSRRLRGLVWDITADKAREAELETRRREAEAADVAKSNFLAVMSHEIRTPLTGVIGMLGLVAAEELSPTQAERVRIADASARGLLRLLNDVLDFSWLQAATVALRPERVRLRDVIHGVTDLMAAPAQEKGLSLTCAVAEDAPEWVVADAVRLRQVLTNIVSNAIAFTHRGGVWVEANHVETEDGGLLSVSVRDTGVGVAEADRARIFERFVQADSSLSRGSGGAGLGLAIARQLVELMGGTIAVESAEGRGSTFRFTARVGRAPDAPAPAAAGDAPDAPPPLRILVAEDNATNQHLIKALLAAGGHQVTVVPNGREAVRAAAEGAFDVVLMDIQMPEMDGAAAAQAIRRLPGPMSGVPIVALTASVLTGDQGRYFAAGMSDYVAKPIDPAALAAALRRASRERREPPAQDASERP